MIDTERKRKSVAWVGQVFSPPTLVPDGSFDQGDRQTVAWSYYGILAVQSANIGEESIAFNLYVNRTRGNNFYIKRSETRNAYVVKSRSIELER